MPAMPKNSNNVTMKQSGQIVSSNCLLIVLIFFPLRKDSFLRPIEDEYKLEDHFY